MTALISFLSFLLAVGILVTFHELGHYWAARWSKVEVEKFSIGFGKPIVTKTFGQSPTQWCISALPLGGYVKMNEDSFRSRPLIYRSFIVAAGPLANFVLAVVLLTFLFGTGVKQIPAKLDEPSSASIAYKAGIYKGDIVQGIQFQEDQGVRTIGSWNQLRWILTDAYLSKESFSLSIKTINNESQVIVFKGEDFILSPNTDPLTQLGILPMLGDSNPAFVMRLNPIEALTEGCERVWLITKISVKMLWGILTGDSSVKQIGGPLSIANMAGQSAVFGWQAYMSFLALVSISLGILNLLPFPMLDGGQLLYDAYEAVFGKKIPESVQLALQKMGVAFLVLLTMLALFNDLTRLFIR